MPEHTGRRRRTSSLPLGRITVLATALVAAGLLLRLPEPERASVVQPPIQTAPTWQGPPTAQLSGALDDGTPYLPRIFLDPQTSIGVASTATEVRLILRAPGRVTELRRFSASSQPQLDGFTAAGETVVWAESLASRNGTPRTTLWRANWRTGGKATSVTSSTAEPTFVGSEYDLVVHGNRVYWAAGSGATQVRSVPLTGGAVSTKRLTGEFVLSAWPWAVSTAGGRGTPLKLVNYDTGATLQVSTKAAETAVCSPAWCRIGVLANDALAELDLVRPDGTGRRRIAGEEATPTMVDVALLDRWVPLTTDRGADEVGLSLYDVTTGQTALVAIGAANVRSTGAMLWWSTDGEGELVWHAIDVRTLV